MRSEEADVVVLGGGLGGSIAALSVAKMGLSVILTEETDWLGGQLTSQAVPPDEHKWIEKFGYTSTYNEFRNRVRQYYKVNYPLTNTAKNQEFFNPGNAWVTRLAHEPKVALKVLEDMLSPYINSGKLKVLYHMVPDVAETIDDTVTSVTVNSMINGEKNKLTGRYFLDATECGDVLKIAGVEYAVGAESKTDTGEPHASETEAPTDMQAITHVLAVDYIEGKEHTINKPDQYDFWRKYNPAFSDYPLLNWHAVNSNDTTTMKCFTLLPNDQGIPSLFTYRRVMDTSHLNTDLYKGDVSLINWPQNDYFLGPIIDIPEEERKMHLQNAKQLSLSLLYWLQTEAPRLDDRKGYPELRLRKDVLGTNDGLAKSPYIRESRRIKATYTVTEMDVSKEIRKDEGIRRYFDSVGVGSYHLDIHHTTVSNRTFYIPTYPFEIPLGALLPVKAKNLLPACKNIGTTQITNGCYRLHPTEWNIGESAGYLTAYAIINGVTPHEVRENKSHLSSYQKLLKDQGIQLHWPEDIDLN